MSDYADSTGCSCLLYMYVRDFISAGVVIENKWGSRSLSFRLLTLLSFHSIRNACLWNALLREDGGCGGGRRLWWQPAAAREAPGAKNPGCDHVQLAWLSQARLLFPGKLAVAVARGDFACVPDAARYGHVVHAPSARPRLQTSAVVVMAAPCCPALTSAWRGSAAHDECTV